MKKIIFGLISLYFAGAYGAESATLESESIRMICESNGSNSIFIVKVKFSNQQEGLYVKTESGSGNTPDSYQSLVLAHNLNDTVYIYESNDFVLNYYSFSTGEQPQLVKKSDNSRMTCNSAGE